ncbi:cytochrome P450 [Bradyrhizobium sp. 197]|uniref:cytochrome P450 n=1 Tax=Bradyrhizobium sp. 197 TaxID=2782663 RepID=UPI001FF9C9C1|nr:cytochrome P450 [Bradyrhizobium sp. 197]
MLATLFDFPFQDRRLLTYWSDVAALSPQMGHQIDSWEKRKAVLSECLDYFTRLWSEREKSEPRADLISMIAHSPATRNMEPCEFLGNLILLIAGGNDTTRNSITGGVLFMSQNPSQLRKLRDDASLVPGAVSEIIRYQTPSAHMRRTAVDDFTIGHKKIRRGDKVVMWYISGNRDDEVIASPNSFIIDRENVRQHLSFGFGIHRCVGRHLAELQLKIPVAGDAEAISGGNGGRRANRSEFNPILGTVIPHCRCRFQVSLGCERHSTLVISCRTG